MTPAPVTPWRILVAEDEAVISRLIKTILEREGHQVTLVESGRDAIVALEERLPDMLLLDVGLPDMSGLEVCHRVREDPLWSGLPVILVTGQQTLDDKLKGFAQGADDYIVKPFRVPEFLARLVAVRQRCYPFLNTSPLTRLPGPGSTEREILRRADGNAPFAVLYVEISNLGDFHKQAGFAAGEELIRRTARVLLAAAATGEGFVSHRGGGEFWVVLPREAAESFCRNAAQAFDKDVPAPPASAARPALRLGGLLINPGRLSLEEVHMHGAAALAQARQKSDGSHILLPFNAAS